MLVNYYYEHNKPSQQENQKRKNEDESEDYNNLTDIMISSAFTEA